MSLEPSPGEGVGPVHSREVPLPLTRDYFEALTPTIPKSARSPPRASSRKVGRVGTGTVAGSVGVTLLLGAELSLPPNSLVALTVKV